ncbi:MAG: molecular chaperone HtpG [Anaerolineae bacterium]|nr:molecular chaperone HtpG [Anaerolineae bacterium]
MTDTAAEQTTYDFQAEIQQLLHILVHALYTERDIFLRELISNASDALSRAQFEALTNRDMRDQDAELAIRITVDDDARTVTISDSGIGMTRDDLINNLGVIARSGARAFIDALKDAKDAETAKNVIGQFGVGFYSVFMVADKVRVVTQSYKSDEPAWAWEAEGGTNFTITPAERAHRGTDVIVTLKDDADDFLQTWKLKDIIRTYSDTISFPIYVGEDAEPTNQRIAIWRQDPKEIEESKYDEFYRSMTFDFNGAQKVIHMRADVPLQFYALLFVPSSNQPPMFSPRKQVGLKLYARKVLIQDYCTDLLPDYLSFLHGVVDSEDIPLSVSRETVRANVLMGQLKKAITRRVLGDFKKMVTSDREAWIKLYEQFGRFLKQGVALSPEDKDDLLPLLLFPTTHDDSKEPTTLTEYAGRMVENQTEIYYIVADDFHSARRSPHLEPFNKRGIEVLLLSDPVDPILLTNLSEFEGKKLRSVDDADLDLSDVGTPAEDEEAAPEPVAEADFETVRARFADLLGERVKGVRASKALAGAPARLVSDDTGADAQMFRVNRLLSRDYSLPVKTLELNPRHPLIHNLAHRIAAGGDEVVDLVIEQVFETALLQDGIHPDPASMADRLTKLMQKATE